MELIGENDELLQLIWKQFRILDASITRIDIYVKDFELCIDVYLFQIGKDEKKFVLNFAGIIEYGFHYNDKHSFYNVERYKFFKAENGYYISFDPVDESAEISDDDQDFIHSKNVKGYFL